jgi:hypothetical protein
MIKIIAILLSFVVLVCVALVIAVFRPNQKSNQARMKGFALGVHGEWYDTIPNPYPQGSAQHRAFHNGWRDGYNVFSNYHDEPLI